MRTITSKYFSITIFSIAMAFLETAVVIYLRELLYPGGFNFPLTPKPGHLVLTEILREIATIVMLIGAGFLAGKTFSTRFAWFIYAFAIWDIFYYVFLKILIDWPESFMTWDILFLIPTTWTAPVLSPIIVSMTMIVLGSGILYYSERDCITRIKPVEWILLITGSLVLIFAFTWDYSSFILRHYNFMDLLTIKDKQGLYDTAMAYMPGKFNWMLFISGEIIIFCGIMMVFRRVKKNVFKYNG